MMLRKEAAFSLVELIIIVFFIGAIAAIAVPKLNFSVSSKMQADTIARKIVTDLRRTRMLAISNAASNTAGFALNMTGSSPYTGYEIQNLDTSIIVDSHSIDSGMSCTGGNQFQFGPLGNLLAGSDKQIVISASEKTFTVTVTPATGMIKCAEN
jgi:Tfp pilus assembly protein FimT